MSSFLFFSLSFFPLHSSLFLHKYMLRHRAHVGSRGSWEALIERVDLRPAQTPRPFVAPLPFSKPLFDRSTGCHDSSARRRLRSAGSLAYLQQNVDPSVSDSSWSYGMRISDSQASPAETSSKTPSFSTLCITYYLINKN